LLSNSKIETVITDKHIRGISLTGSTQAGSEVAKLASKHLKKCVLELGGSDPYIILEDADLPHAVEKCVEGRLINTGQSCIAAKRFIVVDDVYDPFEALFVEKMQQATMGDPFDVNNKLGPLARMNLREDLHKLVTRSVDLGARLLCGGEFPEGDGYFIRPPCSRTCRTGCPPGTKSCLGPWPRSFACATRPKPLQWPTAPRLDWARPFLPQT
jgi:succinate-semialdehyde dehydrogenase / glutarate-semialdehyde dehydrogenase